MELLIFEDGITVKELKELILNWPEEDENGEPCQVWICDAFGQSNQAKLITPLDMRESGDGTKRWADLMLGPITSDTLLEA